MAKLDVVQAKALRVCCGALNSSLIPALVVEEDEAPLLLRRLKIVLNYLLKVVAQGPDQPTKALLEEHWERGMSKVGKRRFVNRVWMEEAELGIKTVAPVVFCGCESPGAGKGGGMGFEPS